MEQYIGIAGDWHGDKGWARLRLLDFADLGITEIIHLGDFGLWPGNSGEKYLHRVNKILAENGQTIFVTLGNHEDYVRVTTFKTITEGKNAGWQYLPAYPNILFAPRPHRWEWSGVSFVSLGGANSIDRAYPHRVENISWWSGEQISYGDVLRTREGGHAEIMISHDCPIGVPLFGGHKAGKGQWSYEDIEYAQQSRIALGKAVDAVKPEKLFYGHYHFYADMTTELMDDDNKPYTLNTIGLDMNTHLNNIGVLTLPSKEFTLIDYKLGVQRP